MSDAPNPLHIVGSVLIPTDFVDMRDALFTRVVDVLERVEARLEVPGSQLEERVQTLSAQLRASREECLALRRRLGIEST